MVNISETSGRWLQIPKVPLLGPHMPLQPCLSFPDLNSHSCRPFPFLWPCSLFPAAIMPCPPCLGRSFLLSDFDFFLSCETGSGPTSIIFLFVLNLLTLVPLTWFVIIIALQLWDTVSYRHVTLHMNVPRLLIWKVELLHNSTDPRGLARGLNERTHVKCLKSFWHIGKSG